MGNAKEYAKKLRELEGYKREIIAFKLVDEEPEDAQFYGEDMSFLCAIAQEVWDDKKAIYITNKNVLCGGALYVGLGNRKITKEEFDAGMSVVIGKNLAYSSYETMRRVNQQVPHFFKTYKYMVIGLLEEIQDPDVVMIIADANKIMRLCKAYTWKTGELVAGLQGTAWCTQSFPLVYRNKTMTFNLGDPPSRVLMQMEPDEVYCTIHYSLLPLIIENLENISDGVEM